jgi:light-regulated signal transduction histidine kinase (bacteriophytochrome)
VVSDVMMPNLDGFGLIRAIRSEPRTAALPIILMSARAGEDATLQGLSSGADDFLMKPFTARELLARVRTHIELAHMRHSFIAELERVHRELDSLSDSMSSDLGTVLHTIDDLSGVLAGQSGHGLEPRAREYVGRIHDAVAHVRRFVDSLVGLADLSRAQVARVRTDLTGIATRVVAGLRQRDPGRDIAVVIAPGLEASGDPRLLDALLTSLIDNAWKFTSRAAHGRIEVGVRRAVSPEDDPVYFVRDNGAGFDMARANRLFSPFQRLHNAAEFDGSGLGLASAHRAVSRHRGRLWAESAPGQGATFYFTLPDRDG